MRYCYLLLIVGLFSAKSNTLAQNLFPNPGFEKYSTCPNSISQHDRCLNWSGWCRGTPDYYNCGFYSGAAALPASGTGVMNFINKTRHFNNKGTYTEGITGSLLQPVKAGHNYEIRFSIRASSNRIGQMYSKPNDELGFGFYFYNKSGPPWGDSIYSLDCNSFKPQVFIPANAIDTYDRYQIFSFCFTPEDNYDSVYIGGVCTPKSEIMPSNGYNFNLDDISLTEKPDTALSATTTAKSVCIDSCLSITIRDSTVIKSISYSAPHSSSSAGTSLPIQLCYRLAGKFPIAIVAKYDGDCRAHIWSDSIKVSNPPLLNFSDTTLCPHQRIMINLSDVVNSQVEWEDGDTTHSRWLAENGRHLLIVMAGGCTAWDTFNVKMLEYCNEFISLPNAFSPNNDGRNDLFRVISNYPLSNFTLRIYNRWGKCVFYDTHYQVGWDGNNCDVGTYFYRIAYEHPFSHEMIYLKGDLALIR